MKNYLDDPSIPAPLAAFLNDAQRAIAHEPPPYCKARNLRPYDPADCLYPNCPCKPGR